LRRKDIPGFVSDTAISESVYRLAYFNLF